ncbi:MAG TPA: (Fe-S)-binding protein [Anaerolineae bacterium]
MPIENVILTTENCRYCLMCRHVAPVEQVTYREALSPHGWGLLIASVRRGLMEWNEDTIDVLYSAPDNGNSRAHCVTNQPLPEAIAAARAEVAAQGLAPAAAYQVNEALQRWANPYEEQTPETAEGQGNVALFVGDDACYLRPATLKAARILLQAVSVEPALIGIGRSNGYLASSLGFPETARRLAGDTLAELRRSGARQLLVLSPGDYFTLGQLYDERLGIEWPAEVTLQEVTSFLVKQVENGTLRFRQANIAVPYAYVDPTHAVRVPGRHDAPRRLLAAVLPEDNRRELFWRRERAHPVGSTALQFTKPDIAQKLTEARLQDALNSGAQLLISEDTATLSHLARDAGRYGLEVQGLYELLVDQVVS